MVEKEHTLEDAPEGGTKKRWKIVYRHEKVFRLLLPCLFSNFFPCVCAREAGGREEGRQYQCAVCVCVLSVLSFELIEKVNHRSFATR